MPLKIRLRIRRIFVACGLGANGRHIRTYKRQVCLVLAHAQIPIGAHFARPYLHLDNKPCAHRQPSIFLAHRVESFVFSSKISF